MRLHRSIYPVESKRIRGVSSLKEVDESWVPTKPALGRAAKWLTVMVEIGVSESYRKLKADAEWWLTNLNGDVKLVIIVSIINRKTPNIKFKTYKDPYEDGYDDDLDDPDNPDPEPDFQRAAFTSTALGEGTAPKSTNVVSCWHCAVGFPSGNKLHAHLRQQHTDECKVRANHVAVGEDGDEDNFKPIIESDRVQTKSTPPGCVYKTWRYLLATVGLAVP